MWCPDVEQDIEVLPLTSPEEQGWYDPATAQANPNDHVQYYQYNITNINPDDSVPPGPFQQEQGMTYWLELCMDVSDPETFQWGWKSSENHWNDDAVWRYGEEWHELFEPFDPKMDNFWANISGGSLTGGGSGYGNGEWYFYPETGWWNQWFYDHPLDLNRVKLILLVLDVAPITSGVVSIAVNYSTPAWSDLGYGEQYPPIPGVPGFIEDEHIGRDVIFEGDIMEFAGHHEIWHVLREFNPEWVSIDISTVGMAQADIQGQIIHDCVQSMDLSFVITGETEAIPTVSQWGMIILVLLVLGAGAIVLKRSRKVAA